MKLLPAIGLVAAGLYLLSKLSFAGNAGRLNYQLSGISLSMSGLNPVVNLSLVVQNPTNQAFQVSAIVANCFLNGTQIGNVSGFTAVTIAPTSQAPIPLTVTVSGLSLIAQVTQILSGSAGVSAMIRVVGTVNANATLLPLDITYQAL